MEKENTTTDEQIRAFGAGSLRKAAVDGNITEGSFMAGQSAGMVKEILPAKEIICKMMNEAEDLLKNAKNRI